MKKHHSDKLQSAIRSLDDALKYARSAEFQELGAEFKSVLIAAVIQNFKLTLAVCRQMFNLLLTELGENNIEGKSFETVLQLAAEKGLIGNLERWQGYLDNEHMDPSCNLGIRTFETASAFMVDLTALLQICERESTSEYRRAA
ncbi:MAG: nucleotidyltransferase substrate binding protein [Planctomycetaceae bacterium]|nr:nucleotidyltransferase substrate binding protein [Planctomycetaceae bacterium]